MSDTIISLFTNNQLLESRYETKLGMSTNDNGRFLRHWYEISICKACFHRKNNDLSEFGSHTTREVHIESGMEIWSTLSIGKRMVLKSKNLQPNYMGVFRVPVKTHSIFLEKHLHGI